VRDIYIYIYQERIKYSPKSINYQVTRTRCLIGIQQVLFSYYMYGAFVEYDGATSIYIHICTHIILYNDVCRTIGPQTAMEGGQDNNNALIRSWVSVSFFFLNIFLKVFWVEEILFYQNPPETKKKNQTSRVSSKHENRK